MDRPQLDFQQALDQFQQLKARWEAGEISAADYEAAVNLLVVDRAGGGRWRLGAMTGSWYRESPSGWEKANPFSLAARISDWAPYGSLNRLLFSGLLSTLCVLLAFGAVVLTALMDGSLRGFAAFRPALPTGAAYYASPTTDLRPPTATLTATFTTVPSPTPSFTPTQIPTLMPTPLPPVMALAPDGPWLLAGSADGLWAGAVQGQRAAFLDLLAGTEEQLVLVSTAPAGSSIAWITSAGIDASQERLTLHIAGLPDGAIRAEYTLHARSRALAPVLAWSPDGRFLAFSDEAGDSSAVLKLYSTEQERILLLEEDYGRIVGAGWSPDGGWLIFFTENPPGVWSANSGSQEVRLLEESGAGQDRLVGWAAPRTAVVAHWDPACHSSGLRKINLETREINSMYSACFESAAVDPHTGSVVFTVTEALVSDCTCGLDPKQTVSEAGIYFLPLGLGLPQPLLMGSYERSLWAPDLNLFFAGSAERWLEVFDSAGQMIEIPAEGFGSLPLLSPQAASPYGQFWAWQEDNTGARSGVWVWQPDADAVRVMPGKTSGLVWETEGGSLLVFQGSELYRLSPPQFNPELLAGSPPVFEWLNWVWQ